MSEQGSVFPDVKLTRNCEVKWDKETKEGRELIENHIEKWLLQLKNGALACPNISCVGKFYHPYQFICHLKSCTSLEGLQKRALLRGTLPCIICSHEILIEKYNHHFRSSHKDINENFKILENSKTVSCLNYKCSMRFKEPFAYLEHCIHCKPLFMCEECKHEYHTKIGLQKHHCCASQKSTQDKDITIDDEKKDPSDINSDKITNEKARDKDNDKPRCEKEILSGKERKKQKSNLWVRRSSRGFKDFEIFENGGILDSDVTGAIEVTKPTSSLNNCNNMDLKKITIEAKQQNRQPKDQGECIHSPDTGESPSLSLETPEPFSENTVLQKVPKKRGRPKAISISEANIQGHTESTLIPGGECINSPDTGASLSLSFETQQPFSNNAVLQIVPKKRGRPKKISISEAVMQGNAESTLIPGECIHSPDTGESPSLSFETQQPFSNNAVLQKVPKKKGRPKKISISEAIIQGHTESTLIPGGKSIHSPDTGASLSLSFETQQPFSGNAILQIVPKKRGRPKKISISEAVMQDNTESTLTAGECIYSPDTEASPPLPFETQEQFSDNTVLQKVPKKRGRPKKISISEAVVQDNTESTLTAGECIYSPDTEASPPLPFETQEQFSDNTVLQKVPKKRGRPKKISISETVMQDNAESSLTAGECIYSPDTEASPPLPFETQEQFSDNTVLQKVPKKRGRPKKISISETVMQDNAESSLTAGECIYSPDTEASPPLPFETQEQFSDNTVLQKVPKKRGRPKKISISEAVMQDNAESTLTAGECIHSPDTEASPPLPFETQQPFSGNAVLQKVPKKRGRPKKISISETVMQDNAESSLTAGECIHSPDTEASPPLPSETQEQFSDNTVLQKVPKKRGRPKKISISETVMQDNAESSLTAGECIYSPDTEASPPLPFETQEQFSDNTVLQKVPKKRGRPKKISISETVMQDNAESSLTAGECIYSPDTEASPPLPFETQEQFSDNTVLQKVPKKRGRPKKISISEAVMQDNAESTLTAGECIHSPDTEASPPLPSETQEQFSDNTVLQKVPKKRGRPKKISISETVMQDNAESTLIPGECIYSPDTEASPPLPFETQQPFSGNAVLQKVPKKRGRPKKMSISEAVMQDNPGSTLIPGECIHSPDTGASPSLSFETQQPFSGNAVLQKVPKKRGRPKKISISEAVMQDNPESTLIPGGECINSPDTGASPSLSFGTQQPFSGNTVLQKVPKKRGRPKKISISEAVMQGNAESTLIPGECIHSPDAGASPSLSFETQQPFSGNAVLQKVPKKRGRPIKISISEAVMQGNAESSLTAGECIHSPDTQVSPPLPFETQEQFSHNTVLQKVPNKRGRPKKSSISEAVMQGNAESTLIPGECIYSPDTEASPPLPFETQEQFSDNTVLQKVPKKRGRPKKISISEAVMQANAESTLIPGECIHSSDTGASPSLSFETQQPFSGNAVLQKVPKKRGRPKKISISEAVMQANAESTLIPGECINSPDAGASLSLSLKTQHQFSDSKILQKMTKKRGRPKKISFSELALQGDVHVSQDVLLPHTTNANQSSFETNLSSFDSQFFKQVPKKRGRPKKFPGIILEREHTLDTTQWHGANDKTAFLNPFEISSASMQSDLSFDGNDIRLKQGKKRGRPRKHSSTESALKSAKKHKAMNALDDNDLSFDSELYESSFISNSAPNEIKVAMGQQQSESVRCSEPSTKASLSRNEDEPCPSSTTTITTGTATATEGCAMLQTNTCAMSHLTNGYEEKVKKKRGRPKKISLPEASLLGKLKNEQSVNFLSEKDNDSQEKGRKHSEVRRQKSYITAQENMKITISRNSKERLVLMKKVSKKSSKIMKTKLPYRDMLQSSVNESIQMDSHIDSNDVMEQNSTAKGKATQQLNRMKESKRKTSLLSMVRDSNVQETIEKWTNLFQSGIFKCPVQNCGKGFRTHMSLLKHIKQCDSKDPAIRVIRKRVTLPCHVCQERFPIFPDFSNHARVYHSNLNFLLKVLESNGKPKCLNHHCDKELNNFNECLEHTTKCGCLLKCHICNRDYKTRVYFAKHTCLEEKNEKEIYKPVKNEESVVLSGVRQSAKRALTAIQSSDFKDDDSVVFSKGASSDDDFDGASMITHDVAEGQEEFEEDDPIEDEADESDSISVTESEADNRSDNRHHDNRSDKKRIAKIGNETVRGVSHAFTLKSKARTPKCISNMNVKPNNPNINFLKNLKATHHTSHLFPQWPCSMESMQFITESLAEKYLPESRVSPLFDIVHENQSSRIVKTNDTQLGRFQTMPPLQGSRTSTFFAGGPIESLEWCPTQGKENQYIAVATRSSYGQVSNCMLKETNNGLIQIWTIPKSNKQSAHHQAHMSLGIVLDSFQVSCMQWCPSSSSHQNNEADAIRRLGILAVGCSDSLIRIFSIPDPEDCISKLSQNHDDQMRNRTFSKFDPNLILAASGCHNMVRCLDWQPMRGYKKIAAGFQDGSVCIWDVETKSTLLRQKSKYGKCNVLQPIKKISAHCDCVTSVMWCANDANFLLTGSRDKSTKTFDVRERNSIPVITVKRALFEGCSLEVSKTGITCIEDEAFSCIPAGSRFVDLILNTFQDAPYTLTDLITAHNAGCKGFSSSQWINGLATSCSAGEVVFRAYETVFHPSYKSIRVPVYRIQTSNLSNEMIDDLKKSNETQQNNEQLSNQQAKSKDITDESKTDHGKSGNQGVHSSNFSAIEIIRKKAQELPTEVFKMKFTFKDCNFFENRKQLLTSTKEADRVRISGSMQESNIENHEMRLITQLKWNPNYGNHHMLASGGFLGFVRIHHFTQWR